MSHGLQLQSLWTKQSLWMIPTAAVGSHGVGRVQHYFDAFFDDRPKSKKDQKIERMISKILDRWAAVGMVALIIDA